MIDRILVIDDEFLIRELLEETALRKNIEVVTAGSGEEGIEILKKEDFQMVFCDMKMKKKTGLDVLEFCNKNKPDILFVLMTAYGTMETAIEAMRLNAFDFFIKPFSPDQMDIVLEKAERWTKLNEQHQYFQEISSGLSDGLSKMIGQSPQIQQVNKLIERVAPTDASILISGESGTGKELIASDVHHTSGSTGPYIRLNCAAIPENLLESELFGHEKGAFTGATERRIGRFELADGGTLLLDEISEINISMQAKLLRVLQESEFERVGGTKTLKVKVRIIATTNRDLKQEIKNGRFREDLYYRLNVFPIDLPPLRNREGDAAEIALHFLKFQVKKLGRALDFDQSAINVINSYMWPGNVRELENVIERIAILEDGPLIGQEAFPLEIRTSLTRPALEIKTGEPSGATLNIKAFEQKAIVQALRQTGGNKKQASALLGFTVRTLRNKIQENNIEFTN